MYQRHEEVPVLSSRRGTVEGRHFNAVHRGLKHLGSQLGSAELRLALPGLKSLDMILRANAWIIVDRALGDLPVVAWVDFTPEERVELHEPVACTLRYYHGHAGIIVKRALALLEALLADRLRADDETSRVIPFPGR